jgi:nitrate reductase gamma subunit
MDAWLEWSRGPAFRFALAFMLLGTARLVAHQVVGLVGLYRRAGNRQVPWAKVARDTARWLLPMAHRSRPPLLLTVVSVLFHAAVIVTPLLLAAHVALWERGLGLSWPVLGGALADWLTLLGLLSASTLLVWRLASRDARRLSRGQDLVLLLLVAMIFASGFLAAHPARNPFGYDATMLVHVLGGDLLLVFVPFSKLAHVVLFPFTQLVSELGWHLAAGSGRAVAEALGKEEEPV